MMMMKNKKAKDEYFKDIDCGQWNGMWPDTDQLFQGFKNTPQCNWPAIVLNASSEEPISVQCDHEPSSSSENSPLSGKENRLVLTDEKKSIQPQTPLFLMNSGPLLPEMLFAPIKVRQAAEGKATVVG